jgi:hypothetical protein
MYLSIISTLFGIFFILFGVAGFLPGFYQNDLLFATFEVDKLHSILSIIVGIIALVCSMKWKSDRMFFQVFGVIFGLLAIAGFVRGGDLIFMHINMADNILHFFIAVIFLVLGFSADKEGRV